MYMATHIWRSIMAVWQDNEVSLPASDDIFHIVTTPAAQARKAASEMPAQARKAAFEMRLQTFCSLCLESASIPRPKPCREHVAGTLCCMSEIVEGPVFREMIIRTWAEAVPAIPKPIPPHIQQRLTTTNYS